MINPISKVITYIQESIAELKKVTWPSKRQTTNYTLLVVGISLGVAIFIGLADFVLTLGVEKIFTK
jgi:preprotein translocase subunit SecE